MSELTNELISTKLQDKFGAGIFASEETYGLLTITADKNLNLEILTFLRDEYELQFKFLTDICGIHFPDSELALGVIYHVHSLTKGKRIRLKFFFELSAPYIRTATGLYPSANWMERETYDFFGIIFEGHPDLRRILNMDEMEAFPMRKEFPLTDPNRTDKKDEFFGR